MGLALYTAHTSVYCCLSHMPLTDHHTKFRGVSSILMTVQAFGARQLTCLEISSGIPESSPCLPVCPPSMRNFTWLTLGDKKAVHCKNYERNTREDQFGDETDAGLGWDHGDPGHGSFRT